MKDFNFNSNELEDFLREDYMESQEMDMIFGELKSSNLSDAKTHSLIYKYLDFTASLLKCDKGELSILEREGIKFELVERYPTLNRFGFDLIENHHIQMQGYSSGIFLHTIDKIIKSEDSEGQPILYKQSISFVRIRFLADVFFIYKTGELCKLIREIKAKQSDKATKPILEEGMLDDIIQETVGYYKNRSKLEEYGIKARKGVLFTGRPGLGKTLLLKYIKQLCRKRNIKFHTISSSELETAYQKDQLEDVFDDEGITCYDDIDISLLSRKRNSEAKKACAILAAMDGVESSNNCVRIFTTNEEVCDFDEALLRPGRLDKVFEFKLPTHELRERFINTWHKDLLKLLNISELTERTEGYTFAELQGIKVEIASRLVRGSGYTVDELLGLKIQVTHTTTKKKEKNGI